MKRILLTYLLLLILPAISIASDLTDFTGVGGDYKDGGDIAGADRTLGSTDNFALGFITNDITRIHIQDDGKIGIGTDTPHTLLTVEGTITIKEQADADGDTDGYGQFWVNTATPNEAFFTDDAGTDFQLGVSTGGSFFVGSFTRDTSLSPGTQVITGVGFQPGAVIFNAIQTNSVGEISWGFTDGTTDTVINDREHNVTNTWGSSETKIVKDVSGPGDELQGSMSSLDADGFTVLWTKIGSPTGTLTIYYLAMK